MTTANTALQANVGTLIPDITVIRHTRSSRIAAAACLVILIAMVTMPWWGQSGHIRWVVEFSVYLAIAQMWNLLAGYAGLVSVGQQAFVGVAGYTMFVLASNFGINPFLAVWLSVLVPGLLALPTYALLHRLDGPYFAIGTWVVAEAVKLIVLNISYVNAGSGMTLRVMSQYSLHEREVGLIWLCVSMLLVTVGGSYWLLRSRHGLALTAMRDNPVAAESQGVNVKRLRFLIFVAAAMGTGLAGSIYYMAQLRITPAAGFNPSWANVCIFIVMVGGVGTIEGVLVGALIYFVADRFFAQYGAVYMVVLGLMTLLTALYARQGIWGLISSRIHIPLFPVGRKLIVPSQAKTGSSQ